VGSGEAPSKARLRKRVVYREPGPWSATVISLLRHLEHVGFDGAPRVVGSGFAPDGRETLSFIPGSSPQPHAWSDEGVFAVGALLRRLHSATATFEPPEDAQWRAWWGRELSGANPVISHCDTGPWNFIARNGIPVAIVDWEFAGPVGVLWELAQTAWLNAQLHDDDVAERYSLPSAEDRARQLRLVLDGYELPASERVGFVDKMIEFATHAARWEAIEAGVVEESSEAVDESGFPVMWAITWRVRSASWMLRNRALLERALI
jgi:hypothetical protein